MHNYGVNDVSKLCVNIASKRVNVARVNVASCGHCCANFLRVRRQSARGSRRAVIFLFFIDKIALDSFVK